MTGPAIILMVAAILIIWGGLIGSVIALQIVSPPYEDSDNGVVHEQTAATAE